MLEADQKAFPGAEQIVATRIVGDREESRVRCAGLEDRQKTREDSELSTATRMRRSDAADLGRSRRDTVRSGLRPTKYFPTYNGLTRLRPRAQARSCRPVSPPRIYDLHSGSPNVMTVWTWSRARGRRAQRPAIVIFGAVAAYSAASAARSSPDGDDATSAVHTTRPR